MTISGFSIKRPVMTTMIMISMIFVGLITMYTMKSELLPNMNIPVVTVTTVWSGAVPEDVETQVTKKIEEVLPNVDGVDKIQSTSSYGKSSIVVSFKFGVKANDKMTEIQREISKVTNDLPSDAQTPVLRKIEAGAGSLTMVIMFTGNTKTEMYSFLDQYYKPQLERISGVGQISIFGSADKQVQIQVDSDKLAAYNMTPVELYNLIRASSVNVALGSLQTGKKSITARFMGEANYIDDFKNMIIKSNGNVLRISDVADVVLTTEDETTKGSRNGEDSVVVVVEKSTDGSSIDINNDVLKALEVVRPIFPPNMKESVTLNTSNDIISSIKSIGSSAVQALILATIVLLIFLKNIRATIIASAALPVAIVFTFAFLSLTGSTLNMISLMGLSIGVGMLTDNSVVVIDNISRHMTELKSPVMEAAENGASEVTSSIIASSLTTMVVFIPILFTTGISREVFRDMAYAIIFSNVAALIVSLTLIPMLASKILNSKISLTKEGRFFSKIKSFYLGVINKAVDHRIFVIFIAVGALIISMMIGFKAKIPFTNIDNPIALKVNFMPEQDQGRYAIVGELGKGLDIDKSQELARKVEEIIKNEPNTQSFFTLVQEDNFSVNIDVGKKDDKTIKRKTEVHTIIEKIRTEVEKIPDIRISMSDQFAMGSQQRDVQMDIIGADLSEIRSVGSKVIDEIKNYSGAVDVKSTMDPGNQEARIILDREKIQSYGLDLTSIGQMISFYVLGGNRGNTVTVKTGIEEIDVLVRLPKDKRKDISQLMNLNLKIGDGQFVKLSDIAHIENAEGTAEINKTDRVYSVSISANRGVGPDGKKVGQGELQTALTQAFNKVNTSSSISYKWGGQSENMTKAFSQLAFALMVSVFLIYALLASQFENFVYPVIILGSIPLALIGVIWGLIITRKTMDIMVFIGIIMLAGIVVNNAIVLIDFIAMLRGRGMKRREAVIEGCRTRLRPILMTTMTTVLGMIPLSMGIGEGSEVYQGMGITILFGLSFSTLLTLIVIPILYTCVEDFNKGVAKILKTIFNGIFGRFGKSV